MGMKGPGGRGSWGRHRKRAEATGVSRLTAHFMADVGWWRWYVQQKPIKEGERVAAPFYRFVKQAPERKWFSDASHETLGGMCMETGVYWKYPLT